MNLIIINNEFNLQLTLRVSDKINQNETIKNDEFESSDK